MSREAVKVEMGGSVTQAAALRLRCRLGRSKESGGLSDKDEGETRGGDGCGTSSALPSMDIDRRNPEERGGGSTGAADDGRAEAERNSCLHKLARLVGRVGALRERTSASPGSGD